MLKEYKFEDYTLVLSRNCNLKCRYCPLEHFEGMMSVEIIKIFLDKLFSYSSHKHYITLFGGEPLINRKAISFICEYLEDNSKFIKDKNLEFVIKIVTNGTLIDNGYLEIFKRIKKLKFVDFIIDISIDGNKITQLNQRPLRKSKYDYYDKLRENILLLSKMKIKLDLFLVMDFFNKSLKEDIFFLLKTFKVPVFLMPVDLSYQYLEENKKDIFTQIYDYLVRIQDVLNFINNTGLYKHIANFRSKKLRDIKLPPIGPAIDYNGDIYVTRDYLFLMDKESSFEKIGTIFDNSFIEHTIFIENNYQNLQKDSLLRYYGRTYNINKKVGDFFTNLVFNK